MKKLPAVKICKGNQVTDTAGSVDFHVGRDGYSGDIDDNVVGAVAGTRLDCTQPWLLCLSKPANALRE